MFPRVGMRNYFVLAEGSLTIDLILFTKGIFDMYDGMSEGYQPEADKYYTMFVNEGETVLIPIGTMVRFTAT